MTDLSPESAERDRRIARIAIVVGLLLALVLAANVLVEVRATEPATSADIDRFVACVQNVVFADPAQVAEARQETIGQPTPAAGTFCERLASIVVASSSTSTPGTTAPG